MITVSRVFDVTEIEKIIYHEKVIHLSTEGGIKGDIDTNKDCWLGTYLKELLVGVFVFNPVNSVSVYAHCYFLPSYRKMVSNTSYMLSMKWLFDESKYKKVIVKCTKKDRQVKGFCLKKGFSLEGEIKQSAAHKGLIVDELIFGITKDDFLGVENV